MTWIFLMLENKKVKREIIKRERSEGCGINYNGAEMLASRYRTLPNDTNYSLFNYTDIYV